MVPDDIQFLSSHQFNGELSVEQEQFFSLEPLGGLALFAVEV